MGNTFRKKKTCRYVYNTVSTTCGQPCYENRDMCNYHFRATNYITESERLDLERREMLLQRLQTLEESYYSYRPRQEYEIDRIIQRFRNETMDYSQHKPVDISKLVNETNKSKDDCSICLESVDDGKWCTLSCKHRFHKNCIEKIITPCCPNCRAVIK